jgi:hypothetical protein
MTCLQFRKNKIRWYRQASDEDIMRCITDRPKCAFAGIHQQLDMPFALREAKRRGLSFQAFEHSLSG